VPYRDASPVSAATSPLRELGGLRVFGVALWLATLLVALSLFGGLLRATTHHRALAGVTFAAGALLVAVGCALVCARIVVILRNASSRVRRVAMAMLGAGAAGAIGILGVRFLQVVGDDPASSAAVATVIDVVAFTLSAGAASLGWGFARRFLAIAGPPVAVFLAALGMTTLRDPPVCRAIGQHAPAFEPAANFVSGR
jgi:choline-sulfatase